VRRVPIEALGPGGVTRLYEEEFGIRRAAADAHYRPTLASREEARSLRIERDSALIEERRVSYFVPDDRKNPSSDALMPYEYLLSLYTDRASLDFSWCECETAVMPPGGK